MSTKKSDSMGEAFMQGMVDRFEYGLLEVEQMYRRPRRSRFAWRLGWRLANTLTRRPLRTHAVRKRSAA